MNWQSHQYQLRTAAARVTRFTTLLALTIAVLLIGAAHSLEHKLFIASVAGVTNEHAELVTDGKVLEIGAGSVASYATDINGRGQATGWVETNRIGHAFFVDRK